MTNKIDIMLPYWGDFKLLKKTIDSVLSQTNKNWALTIIDDCYPSLDAEKYCKSIANNKIKYIRHDKNIGITNNFNYCIENVKSEYCMILGCDDILLPNYIESTLKNIADADFYQPGVQVIDANDNIYLPLGDQIKRLLQPKKSSLLSNEKLALSLCNGNWLYFPSITWKSSTLKKYRFNTEYKIVEDLALEFDIIKDGGKLYFDKIACFQYRRFSESVSSKEKKAGGLRFNEENDVYKKYSKIFKEIGWKKASIAAKMHITSRIHGFLSK